MGNAILLHYLAFEQCDTAPLFGSIRSWEYTLVYCYDLRPIYDTLKYYVQEEWKVTKSGHQYHTQSYIYHIAKKKNGVPGILTQYFRVLL